MIWIFALVVAFAAAYIRFKKDVWKTGIVRRISQYFGASKSKEEDGQVGYDLEGGDYNYNNSSYVNYSGSADFYKRGAMSSSSTPPMNTYQVSPPPMQPAVHTQSAQNQNYYGGAPSHQQQHMNMHMPTQQYNQSQQHHAYYAHTQPPPEQPQMHTPAPIHVQAHNIPPILPTPYGAAAKVPLPLPRPGHVANNVKANQVDVSNYTSPQAHAPTHVPIHMPILSPSFAPVMSRLGDPMVFQGMKQQQTSANTNAVPVPMPVLQNNLLNVPPAGVFPKGNTVDIPGPTGVSPVLERAKRLSAAPSINYSELELVAQIGAGAFGSVWKGSWQGTPVAIKELNATCQGILNDEGIQAFEDEVDMMYSLRHPNICLFMGASLTPPKRAIVTELVNRGSLWDCLRSPDPQFKQFMHASFPGAVNTCQQSHWPLYAIRKIVEGTCKGLAYLHGRSPQPIIHRDLKSANLLLTDSFDVKICDFGLARLRDASSVMTANVGTVHWMAPEVLSGKKYNEKADIYSLAIVIWEMFTGQCPYDNKTQVQIAVGVVQKNLRPDLPPYLSHDVRQYVSDCWNMNPSKRDSAQQMLHNAESVFG
jgi:hypothetical protein